MTDAPQSYSEAQINAAIELAKRKACEDDLYFFLGSCWKEIEGGKPFVGGQAVRAMCEHLEEVYYGRIKRLLINIPPRSTKPVASDSKVFCEKKGIIDLCKISVGDFILTHTGVYKEVIGVYPQGVLSTLKIKTARGREIVAEKTHPFLTPNGWVNAGDLQTGSVLAAVMQCPDSGYAVEPETARLLGYLIGDGCLSLKSTPNITVNDEIEENDIKHCIHTVGFNYSHGIYRIAKSDSRHYGRINVLLPDGEKNTTKKGSVNSVRKWMIKHGIDGGNSYTKMVPNIILQSDKTGIVNFIAAYWACDGYVSSRSKKRSDLQIGCDSVNKEFLIQIQLLLQKLGINSTLRKKISNIKTKKQGDKYTSYCLAIADADNCSRFCSLIKIPHKKQEKIESYYKIRYDFDKVLSGDSIISIEDNGTIDCMCIEVMDDHSFVCNGIAVRNSTTVSVVFPIWCWIKNPSLQFLTVSYAEKFSKRDNVRARRLLKSDWFQTRWGDRITLADDQDTKERVDNMQGGYRVAAGMDGSITGEGGDLILLDDPNNTGDQSEASLENAMDKFTGVLPTRFNDFKNGRMVVVQQRVNEGDVSGWILNNQAKEYVKLILPMEYEPERHCVTVPLKSTGGKPWEDWRKKEGDLLLPERLGARELERLKSELQTEYKIAGQLQQRPAPAAGGIIKKAWFQPWKNEFIPRCSYIIQSWDTASSTKKEAAYSACTTWGIFKDDNDQPAIILLGAWRKRVAFPELYETVQRMTRDYGWTTPERKMRIGYRPDLVLVEEKSTGIPLIQTLNKAGSMLTPWKPDKYGDKVMRVRRITHLLEAGCVFVPMMAPDFKRPRKYADVLINQCASFPNADSRDFVDTMTMTLQRVINSGWILHPLENQARIDEDLERSYSGEGEGVAFY